MSDLLILIIIIIFTYSAASNWCTDFRIVSHEIFSIELARVSQAEQFASHTFIIWCHKVSKYLVMWNYVPHFTTYLHATWLSWHRCSEFALIISVVSGSRNYFKLISVNLFRICAEVVTTSSDPTQSVTLASQIDRCDRKQRVGKIATWFDYGQGVDHCIICR